MKTGQLSEQRNRIIHWAVFIQPVLIMTIFLLLMCFGIKWMALYSTIFFFMGLFLGAWCLVRFYTTSLIIENNEYFIASGLLNKVKIKLPLEKKESVVVRQNILGQFLHYASLSIIGIGGSNYTVGFVKSSALKNLPGV